MRAINKPKRRRFTITNVVKPIDWSVVDKMLRKGCNGVEVAARLGICPDTLYVRCQKEKGTEFTAYSAQKRSDGAAFIREIQYDVAVEDRENTMLIWVGKQLCDQREPESRTAEICRPALLEFLDKLKKSTE